MKRYTQNLLTEINSTMLDHRIAVETGCASAHTHELRLKDLMDTVIPLLEPNQLEELHEGTRQHWVAIFH